MLRLVNSKSGHKSTCIHHETNGEPYLNSVRSLGRKYFHLINNKVKMDCLMSELFERGNGPDIKNDAM